MDDPYLNKMLDTVSTDLWGWDQSIHFAIMSISPKDAEDLKDKAERLKSEYGVDTVFYEDFDDSHRGLDHIVAEISERCADKDQPPIDIVEGQPPIDIGEEQPPIDEDVLDWLEQTNQRMEGKN